MSNLAIIPSRGGSKRIPRKNIRDFFGFPIIKYPINVALKSACFDEVMVSTDDQEIAALAKSYGAAVPFLRSQANADDQATTIEVVQEVVLAYAKQGKEFETICCLYPTAVFVTPKLLQKAARMIQEPDTDEIVTIVPYEHPLERALVVVDESPYITFRTKEYAKTRTQDLPVSYHDAAQVYFLKTKAFLAEKAMFLTRTKPIIMDPNYVQDIDTLDDWSVAERKYEVMPKEEV